MGTEKMSDRAVFWMTFAAVTLPPALGSAAAFGSWARHKGFGTLAIGVASFIGALAGFVLGMVIAPYVFRALS